MTAPVAGKQPFVGMTADGIWHVAVWDHQHEIGPGGGIVQRWIFPCDDLSRCFDFETEARSYAAQVNR